ncbi:hypothetical protein HDR58_07585 [bacterium]|nr:hypothetical protein [bacterium]
MLTIQPNFTQYSAKNTTFRGVATLDEKTYNEQRAFYERQKQEFEDLINDDHIPESGKKIMNLFKIVSEGVLEGWAVLWGATKGAKAIKSFAGKIANGKAAKWATEVLKPITKGVSDTGSKIAESVKNKITDIQASKTMTTISDKFTEIISKIDDNKIGHSILETFRYVNKKLNPFNKDTLKKITEPLKNTTYDGVAKATATTLGVGSGLAGAYNAARKVETKNSYKNDDSRIETDELADEIDLIDNKIEDEDID